MVKKGWICRQKECLVVQWVLDRFVRTSSRCRAYDTFIIALMGLCAINDQVEQRGACEQHANQWLCRKSSEGKRYCCACTGYNKLFEASGIAVLCRRRTATNVLVEDRTAEWRIQQNLWICVKTKTYVCIWPWNRMEEHLSSQSWQRWPNDDQLKSDVVVFIEQWWICYLMLSVTY